MRGRGTMTDMRFLTTHIHCFIKDRVNIHTQKTPRLLMLTLRDLIFGKLICSKLTFGKLICGKLTLFAFTMLTLTLLAWPDAAWAATAKATVSKNTVELNEPFQLNISVDANLGNNALDLTPIGKNFNYGRPHLSNSTSIINGTVTRLTQWRIVLAAKEVGRFTLPSFTLDGMKTLPISIKVVASDPKNKNNAENIKIISTLNREEGYIGETFVYHVRLMIGAQVESLTLQAPFGDGLTVEQIGKDVQSETLINGRQFVLVNRKYQITPTKVGKLYLEGAILTGTEITGNKWGSTLGVPFSRKTTLSTLNVKDKPADHIGLWLPTPALELSQYWEPEAFNDAPLESASKNPASVHKLSVKVGEPINRILTLKIKNMAQSAMPDLDLKYPDRVRVYSDKPEYTEEGSFRVMRVKQVIIPRAQGNVTLPGMKITWFNTTTKKEEVTQIPGLTLNIEQNDEALSAQPVLPPNPPLINNAQSSLTPAQALLCSSYWPWATGLFAFLWLITLILYLHKLDVFKRPEKSISLFSLPLKNTFDALKMAVKTNDALTVATQYPLWCCSHLPNDMQQQIEAEIHAMMASYYSKDTNKWDNTHLLFLLKKASKVKIHPAKGNLLNDLE